MARILDVLGFLALITEMASKSAFFLFQIYKILLLHIKYFYFINFNNIFFRNNNMYK